MGEHSAENRFSLGKWAQKQEPHTFLSAALAFVRSFFAPVSAFLDGGTRHGMRKNDFAY